jgi:hypothetical protein
VRSAQGCKRQSFLSALVVDAFTAEIPRYGKHETADLWESYVGFLRWTALRIRLSKVVVCEGLLADAELRANLLSTSGTTVRNVECERKW